MLRSLMSLPPGTPRPSELDFFLSLLHHFQSGWALKWASLTCQHDPKQISTQSRTTLPNALGLTCTMMNLEGQIVVLLLLLGAEGIPPLPQNLADRPVVLVWVPLMYQCSMTLAEDHKSIHGSPDVVLLPLKGCTQCKIIWKGVQKSGVFASALTGRPSRDCSYLHLWAER